MLGFEPGRRDSWAYAPEGRLFDPRRAAREAAAAGGGNGGGGGLASSPSFSASASSAAAVSAAQARDLRAFAARLGMPLRHVVALAGAHCLGRWWPDAEATASAGPSDGAAAAAANASPLPLMTAPPPGAEGSPRFDNSYFTRLLAGSLPPDEFLLADPETKLLVEEYAASEATFFVDYSTSHDELSRLGMPRGAGGWHRQHQQEQQKGGAEEARHKRGGGAGAGGASRGGERGSASAAAAAAAAPAQSVFDPARRSSGGRRGGPPPPPSYWASCPAIDHVATVLGVSPGAVAAASAAVGAAAVVGGAALVWSRRKSRLQVGRRR